MCLSGSSRLELITSNHQSSGLAQQRLAACSLISLTKGSRERWAHVTWWQEAEGAPGCQPPSRLLARSLQWAGKHVELLCGPMWHALVTPPAPGVGGSSGHWEFMGFAFFVCSKKFIAFFSSYQCVFAPWQASSITTLDSWLIQELGHATSLLF